MKCPCGNRARYVQPGDRMPSLCGLCDMEAGAKGEKFSCSVCGEPIDPKGKFWQGGPPVPGLINTCDPCHKERQVLTAANGWAATL